MIDFDAAIALAAASGARLIAIDGLPVSGKSTLADRMAAAIGAKCIFLDDFVRPEPEWRGKIEPAFPFGFIRYDAFVAAVRSVARGEGCGYPLYDWETGRIGPDVREIAPGERVIVEGTSSLNPDLASLYDLSFWIESDAATTLSASLTRGVGDWATEWRDLFLPSVELYLETRPQERATHRVAGRGAKGGAP